MILLIGDIHGRNFWKKPIQDVIDGKLDVERIIFIGDYFDPYPSEGITEMDAIKNFLDLYDTVTNNLSSHMYRFLVGNHDFHYISDYFYDMAGSTRYSDKYENTIKGFFKDVMKPLDMRFACREDIGGETVYFSHAGISNSWYKELKSKYDKDEWDVLFTTKVSDKVDKRDKFVRLLGQIGEMRGGYNKTGSCLWCDIREFYDDKRIGDCKMQIFGHTNVGEVPVMYKDFACIDCSTACILMDDLSLFTYDEYCESKKDEYKEINNN